jgi:hypothetical protein
VYHWAALGFTKGYPCGDFAYAKGEYPAPSANRNLAQVNKYLARYHIIIAAKAP